MKTHKETTIQICPNCGSPDIQTDFSNPAAIMLGFMTSKTCNNCGFSGEIFPIVPISKLKKPIKYKNKIKTQNNNQTFFSGIIGVWKAIGIILIFFGIIYLSLIKFELSTLFIGGSFILLGIILTVYTLLWKRYKNNILMKIIMILLILTLVIDIYFSLI